MSYLKILQATLLITNSMSLEVTWTHNTSIPASAITTYGQFYQTFVAFPDNQWLSLLVTLTTLLAGSLPAPSKIWINILAKLNLMHLFAHVTPSGQVTTFHFFSQISMRMGQSKTYWDDRGLSKYLLKRFCMPPQQAVT